MGGERLGSQSLLNDEIIRKRLMELQLQGQGQFGGLTRPPSLPPNPNAVTPAPIGSRPIPRPTAPGVGLGTSSVPQASQPQVRGRTKGEMTPRPVLGNRRTPLSQSVTSAFPVLSTPGVNTTLQLPQKGVSSGLPNFPQGVNPFITNKKLTL